MNKIIVTGVTGQMGSYMVDYLLANTEFDIIGTVRRLSVPNHDNISHIKNKRFSLATMDLGDSHSIEALIKENQPLYFINCAANSFVGSSWQLPVQHMQYNAIGVLHQLEAIRKHSPHTRYFNMGSSEEFADAQYVPQDENHPIAPRSPYAASKAAARHLVAVYRKSYGMYALQGITFNFESPRRGVEFLPAKSVNAIAKIKNSLKNNLPIEPLVLGNLESKRSWQHCLDVCDGVWRMLNQDIFNEDLMEIDLDETLVGRENQDYAVQRNKLLSESIKEYVLSANYCNSVRELVELALNYSGVEFLDTNPEKLAPVEWRNGQQVNYVLKDNPQIPLIVSSLEFYRPADVTHLHGDSFRIKKELGWSPKYNFELLIKEMVDSALTKYVQ